MTTLSFLILIGFALGVGFVFWRGEHVRVVGLQEQIADLKARNEILFHTALEAANVTVVNPAERAESRAQWVAEQQNRRKKLTTTLRDLERQHAAPLVEARVSEGSE